MKYAKLLPFYLLSVVVSLFVVSCTMGEDPSKYDKTSKNYVNPYKEGTYEHFVAGKNYPKTSNAFRNHLILSQMSPEIPEQTRIVVSLSQQRAFLMHGDQVAIDYPISSGRGEYPTPDGRYKVIEKIKDKRSNLYGKLYDAEGKLIKKEADMKVDKVPEGGKYVGVAMPYWMRLTWSGVGHHVGKVPRYPASHSCIRGPSSIMPIVFSKVVVGTWVEILP